MMNNSTLSSNTVIFQEYSELSVPVSVLLGIMTSLLAILTVGSNLVLILVIVRTPYLHTKTNAMLISVAASEFLVGLFVMPFIATFWIRQDLAISKESCEFCAFMTSLTTTSKSLGMLCVSVDRCLAVSHPLQYTCYITKVTTGISLTSVWTVTFAFAIFPLFNVGRYTLIPDYNRCLLSVSSQEIFTLVKEITCSLLPAAVTVVSLMIVLLEARSHHRVITMAQLAIAMYSGPAAVPGLNRYTRSTYKAMRTYIIITLIYLFTCFPMSVYIVIVISTGNRHSNTTFILLTLLTYICCVATPLVITTLSSKFKNSVKTMFIRPNRVKPLEKEAFTISTGLHSILETSMVVQYVPKKDSVKFGLDDPAVGPSGHALRFAPRRISVLHEVQSSSSSDNTQKHGHSQLRKTLSSP